MESPSTLSVACSLQIFASLTVSSVNYAQPVAKAWDYVRDVSAYDAHQSLARQATEQGYNVIKYESYRGVGYNYALLDNPLNPFNFDEWLIPQMVSPAR